jgi:hypothetical protein
MDEVKSLVIVPEHRTVLPGSFKLNRCQPPQPLTESHDTLFLPRGNVAQQFYSGHPMRCGFSPANMPHHAGAGHGSWSAMIQAVMNFTTSASRRKSLPA